MGKTSLYVRLGTTGLLAFLAFGHSAHAQLTVTPQTDLQAMAQNLAGPGVTIMNPTIQCNSEAYGEFTYSGNALGATAGILLTTGKITNAIGPNSVSNKTFQHTTAGDPLLNIVTNRTTYDACRFEFDVIPSGDSIEFDFVLGSEEYHEWVGSQYNDVFGFFISGPGITGDPGIGNEKNIALIPGSSSAVMINNVNNGSNQQYFQNNVGGAHIQYDGLTTGLKAVSIVQPCQTYHLKLVVADASDRKFDTGVFIQKIISNAVGMQVVTQLGIPQFVEGCNPGVIRFTRPSPDPTPLTFPYYIFGTATNGIDVSAIGDPDTSIPKYVTIPSGATYTDVAVDPIQDGIAEGSEMLRFILGNPNCPTAISDTLDVSIVDELPVTVIPGNTTICAGGSVQFTASGGAGYSWSPAAGLSAANIANPVATPAVNTTYTATITYGACSRTIQRTVTVTDLQLSTIVTRPLCNGAGNGAINLTVSGGIPPYSFNWSGPNGTSFNTEDLVNIVSGTYSVTATDANGCTKSGSFNVNTPAALTATTNAPVLIYGQNIACAGSATGSINLSINGGTAPYSVAWSGPDGFTSNSQNLNSVGAGTYTATITDVNGCSVQVSRTLTEPPPMEAAISDAVDLVCYGSNTGSATATISGGMPPYSYSWNTSPIQNAATAVALHAGIHTVTITDGYGCQANAVITIAQPASALAVGIADVTAVRQCQDDPAPYGSATASGSGGTAPYSYSWNTIPVQTTPSVDLLTGGTYDVIISDANGCTATTSAIVPGSVQTTLQTDAIQHIACFGNNTGGATISATGSAITSIVWNTVPQQTSTQLTGVASGSYSAITQHANGCESTISVTIDEMTTGPLIAATMINGTAVTCFGQNNGGGTLAASGGTAPYTFELNGSLLPGDIIAGAPAGEHTVIVTDQNGCSAMGSIVIDGPSAPVSVNITGFTNELCFGGAQGTASAQASGGTSPYSYEWNSTPAQTGPNAIDLPQGTYTVTVTDANGCTATADVTIGGPQFAINGMIEDYAHVSCFGSNDGTATVSVWGGSNSFTVTWNTVPPQIGLTATGLAPGMYMAEVVDNNGCDSPKFLPIEIQGPSAPLIHSITSSNANCATSADGAIDVTMTGGYLPYNYIWTNEAGDTNGLEDLSGLDPGIYHLSVSDGNGCTITDTITIDAPEPIALQIVPFTYPGGYNVSCTGADDGNLGLTISGGTAPYSIAWSNNQGYASSLEDIDLLGAGIYDVLVTDENGCTASGSIELTAPETISLSATVSEVNGYNISCTNTADGWIDMTVNGGLQPYTYEWNNGSANEDLGSLQVGNFVVLVTDANGCSATAAYDLIAPEQLVVEAQAAVLNGGYGTSCSAAADGSISAALTGGVAPFSIQWNGPNGFEDTDLSIDQLIAGSYTITVTDGNACVATSTVQITSPAPLSIGTASTTYNGGYNIRCAGDSTGSINTSVIGGISPYSYAWILPDGSTATSTNLTDVPAGQFDLTVTDQNGCTASSIVVLTEPLPLNVVAATSDAGMGYNVSCSENDGSIDLSVAGGTPGYNFSWIGPNGSGSIESDLTALDAGVYSVAVTDENGCIVEQSILLTRPDPIVASFSITQNTCAGGSMGSIVADISGGAAGYDLQWLAPDGSNHSTDSIGGMDGGTYLLNVIDQLGCSASFNVELSDPAPIVTGAYISFYGMYNLQCAGDSTGVIELDPDGGTAPYLITVNGPNGSFSNATLLENLIAGDYSVNITDQNGCMLDTLITLTEPTDPINASFNTSVYPSGTNVSCFNGNDGWIEAEVSGGIGSYEIFWRGPDSLIWNMSNIYDLPAGDYSYELVVIDGNQCTFNTDITLTQPDTSIQATSISSQFGDLQISCPDANDGSIDLGVTGGNGGYTYSWIGPLGYVSTAEDITGLIAGMYQATITDINGCVLDHTVQLNAPDQLAIAFASMDISCYGAQDGIIQADISGGAGQSSHVWNGPAVAPDAQLQITDLAAGSYCLEVTDENGCTFQDCIIISEPDQLLADAIAIDASCGTANGSIDLIVSGGSMPYDFNWDNGSDSEDLSNVPAGIYSVTISDGNGCALSSTIEVDGSSAIIASATITDVACAGGNNGAIDLTIEGGNAPFTLQWSSGSQAEDLASLSAGDHFVSITDANGCVTEANFTVNEADPIQIDTTLSIYSNGYNISSSNGSDGNVLIIPQGGTAPYTINWSNGTTGEFQGALQAGTYMIQVTDANGCAAELSIELLAPNDLEMPTGYSPNGDGANDVFFIRGLDAYPKNTFTVYNRWGNVVFDRLNYKNDWAGENSNGEELANGTYFVILTVADGERKLQGYVDMRR